MVRVKTAAFKLHLGKYLRAVRGGEEIVVLDRDQPVARVIPWDAGSAAEPLSIEEPAKGAPRPGAVAISPVRASGPVTALLLEERARR